MVENCYGLNVKLHNSLDLKKLFQSSSKEI